MIKRYGGEMDFHNIWGNPLHKSGANKFTDNGNTRYVQTAAVLTLSRRAKLI